MHLKVFFNALSSIDYYTMFNKMLSKQANVSATPLLLQQHLLKLPEPSQNSRL